MVPGYEQIAAEGSVTLEDAIARRGKAEAALSTALTALDEDLGESFVVNSVDKLKKLSKMTDEAELATREWANRASEVRQSQQQNAMSVQTLQELSSQLAALSQLGALLQQSDSLEHEEDINAIEKIYLSTDMAKEICIGRGSKIFQKIDIELSQRREDALLLMQNCLIDAVVATSSEIEIRQCSPTVADVLLRTEILENTISKVTRMLQESEDLLWGIRKADVFTIQDDMEIVRIEWSRHRTYPYDFPASIQLEQGEFERELPDELSSVGDIANILVRVELVYNGLAVQMIGSRESTHAGHIMLSRYLWTWLSNKLFEPSLVLASDGPTGSPVAPASSLAKRCNAAYALSRLLPDVLEPFDPVPEPLFANAEAVHLQVAAELRSQLLLRARRSVTDFILDDEDHVLLAPIASPWRPRERRTANWFPSCLVTRTCLQVSEVVQRACSDATGSAIDGNEEAVIPKTLFGTAVEALDAYRVDIPILHQHAFQMSLKLRCLYHNDCLMLAHIFTNLKASSKLVPAALKLKSAGQEVLLGAIDEERARLRESFANSSFGDGSLTHYGSTRVRKRCDQELMRMMAHNQEVCRVYSAMLPASAAGNAIANLCAEFLMALTGSVLVLPEIAAAACDGLELLLASSVANCDRLASQDRLREADGDASRAYQTAVRRAQAFQEILNIRMEDIVINTKQKKYSGLLERNEVENLILSIFEDTQLRTQLLGELKDDTVEESWGW